MATVVKGGILIAIVGVIVSGAVALAISETKLATVEEDVYTCREQIESNDDAINDIECTLSGMSADVRWIVVTLDEIRNDLREAKQI